MLYLSTRNTIDCFTSYRALNELQAPDGGFYIPFHLQRFTDAELAEFRKQSPCEAIARVMNLFFSVGLTGWDVECVIGRCPVKVENVNQRLLFAEYWRNPDGSVKYLINNLFRRITAKEYNCAPSGWAYIAIEVALLFGLYAATENIPIEGLDAAVEADDFADITAIEYARQMGLPVNTTVCTASENSAVWDFFAKGDYNSAAGDQAKYLECFLFVRLGKDAVLRYVEACEKKRIYRVDEEQLEKLSENIFCSVISVNRVDSIISGMYRANGYAIDPHTAVAYGGLQDYRANTGLNRDTLILAKNRPEMEKG